MGLYIIIFISGYIVYKHDKKSKICSALFSNNDIEIEDGD